MVASKGKDSVWKNLYHIPDYGYHMARSTFLNEEVLTFINNNQTFDLLLLEDYLNEAHLGFSHIFQCPVTMIRLYISQASNFLKLGTLNLPSVTPNLHSKFTSTMTFFQRVQNFMLTWFEIFVMNLWQVSRQKTLYEEFFPNPKPPLMSLIRNVSLILQNTHFSTSYRESSALNSIDIGGLHISSKRTKLPKVIQDFINSSERPVVYFALGGNVEVNQFSVEKQKAIFSAFQKSNIKVIMKIKGTSFKVDGNILMNSWFPQNDILAHQKVKIFITHGGIQSIYEAVYHAVPVIGIPVFGDQPHNVAFAEEKGFGVLLAYENLTEFNIFESVKLILENEHFQENAIKISKLFHDRPNSPLQNAIYWIEYVIRHKGAYHLKNLGVQMGIFQYYSLDVIIFILLLIFLFMYVLFFLFKKVKTLKVKKD